MSLIEVGKIINTHGLKGEVKAVSWTDTPEIFESLEHLYAKTRQGQTPLTLRRVKYQKNNLILQFSELTRIEDAEPLKNCILLAERDDLGELPEGVYYIADLLGLEVYSDAGELLGILSDVLQTGANDVYVVKRENARDLLIPVIDETIRKVDLDVGRVTVTLMDGLEDL